MRYGLLLVLCIVFGGCDSPAPAPQADIVVTTTMLGDMTRQIAGDDFIVGCIMKPGGDPHLYQPTPADARMVAQSQMVVMSGLHLEGWIEDLVRNAGGAPHVVIASKPVEPIRMKDAPGGVDPHFWFDAKAWSAAAGHVGKEMMLLSDDPNVRERIQLRTVSYQAKVVALDTWVRQRLRTVQPKHRVLITSHDAFNYFGAAYGIDVVGIQGTSTEQEASQRDVANIVDLVRARNAPAVCVESSVNPALIQQVAREANIEVAGPLYSDSVGPVGSGAETYEGMMAENVRIIVKALGGDFAPFELASR